MYGQNSFGLKVVGQIDVGQNDIGRNVIGRNIFWTNSTTPALCTQKSPPERYSKIGFSRKWV